METFITALLITAGVLVGVISSPLILLLLVMGALLLVFIVAIAIGGLVLLLDRVIDHVSSAYAKWRYK